MTTLDRADACYGLPHVTTWEQAVAHIAFFAFWARRHGLLRITFPELPLEAAPRWLVENEALPGLMLTSDDLVSEGMRFAREHYLDYAAAFAPSSAASGDDLSARAARAAAWLDHAWIHSREGRGEPTSYAPPSLAEALIALADASLTAPPLTKALEGLGTPLRSALTKPPSPEWRRFTVQGEELHRTATDGELLAPLEEPLALRGARVFAGGRDVSDLLPPEDALELFGDAHTVDALAVSLVPFVSSAGMSELELRRALESCLFVRVMPSVDDASGPLEVEEATLPHPGTLVTRAAFGELARCAYEEGAPIIGQPTFVSPPYAMFYARPLAERAR